MIKLICFKVQTERNRVLPLDYLPLTSVVTSWKNSSPEARNRKQKSNLLNWSAGNYFFYSSCNCVFDVEQLLGSTYTLIEYISWYCSLCFLLITSWTNKWIDFSWSPVIKNPALSWLFSLHPLFMSISLWNQKSSPSTSFSDCFSCWCCPFHPCFPPVSCSSFASLEIKHKNWQQEKRVSDKEIS